MEIELPFTYCVNYDKLVVITLLPGVVSRGHLVAQKPFSGLPECLLLERHSFATAKRHLDRNGPVKTEILHVVEELGDWPTIFSPLESLLPMSDNRDIGCPNLDAYSCFCLLCRNVPPPGLAICSSAEFPW